MSHYAGEVLYNTTGFLEKNKDTLHDDLAEVFQNSENPFIAELYKDFEIGADAKKRKTVSAQFKVFLLPLHFNPFRNN